MAATGGSTNPIEAGNRAANQAEAERYVEWLEFQAEANSADSDPYDDEFVPGSRHNANAVSRVRPATRGG
jgi:hypothetical protein